MPTCGPPSSRTFPRAVAASLLATLAIVALSFRERRSMARVILSLLVGVFWTVGILALWKFKLNFLNFIALPVTFGIGVDYAVNIVQRDLELRDPVEVLRRTGGAVVLCSLTTLLGYLALARSLNYGVRSLGITAVIGEAACLVAAVMWLPAALVWLRQRRAPETVPHHRRGRHRLISRRATETCSVDDPTRRSVPLRNHRLDTRPRAASSASSSRSFPQYISPSTKNVGAPKMPRAWARCTWARSFGFSSGDCVRAKDRPGRQRERFEHLGHRLHRGDVPVLGEVGPGHRPAEGTHPRRVPPEQRDPHREHRVLRKPGGLLPGQSVLRRLALHVLPHVGALLLLEDEWRALPPERLEDRPQQERLPAHRHPGLLRQRVDAHQGEVAVVAGQVEPQLDRGAHRKVTRTRASMLWRGGASDGAAG